MPKPLYVADRCGLKKPEGAPSDLERRCCLCTSRGLVALLHVCGVPVLLAAGCEFVGRLIYVRMTRK
jgi:hypothetical protein